jgi:hypothetical protein
MFLRAGCAGHQRRLPRGDSEAQAQSLAKDLPAEAWEKRVSAGTGSKGERLYDWACVALPQPEATAEAGGLRAGRWLVVRRHIDDPSELAYYPAYGPKRTPAGEPIRVVGRRWAIEKIALSRPRGKSVWTSMRSESGMPGTGT